MAKTRSISPPSKPDTGGSRRESTGFAGRHLILGGHLLTAVWLLLATSLTGLNARWASSMESKLQSLFFEVRGVVEPPDDIVILAMDDASFSLSSSYQIDPERYAFLEPIQRWPWRREAYALALEKVMGAGAKVVAFDILFDASSAYGEADDQRLADAIAQYPDRVVLAAQHALRPISPQRTEEYLISPISRLRPDQAGTGLINYFVSPNGEIQQLGREFIEHRRQALTDEEAELFDFVMDGMPTLAEATLQAAREKWANTRDGSHIFFYGPGSVFPHISFVDILDPEAWARLEADGYFKDKIVLVGGTSAGLQDFHDTPFSQSWLYPQKMAGVEIHAQSIATLLENRAIADALPSAPGRGVFVLGLAGLAGWLLSRPRQPLKQWIWAMGLAIAWVGAGYLLFIYGRLIVPTALPAGAIALSGVSQLLAGTVREQQKKKQLRDTLRQYATSPIVQEIISQQDDLHDLLHERELALSGKRLANRYRIIRVLGAGGFSETYIAEDVQRPGNPLCVVKQLRVVSDNPNAIKMARRLFATEAETLEHLGQHDQIPQLLACFEENEEFYLVQEFIPGRPLSHELLPQRSLSEEKVVRLLVDLLGILDFVHSYGVIHRDLKPSNIIRRKQDGKLVLIDFGIAKKITTQLADLDRHSKFTVAVGTPGYMPSEQSAGRPHFSSDIYALGIMAIEALTGISPQALKHDAQTGEVQWQSHAPSVSSELKGIVETMVRHDFTQRYSSVDQVQQAIAQTLGVSIPDRDRVQDDCPTAPEPGELELDAAVDEEEALDTVSLPQDWSERLLEQDQIETVSLLDDWGDRPPAPEPPLRPSPLRGHWSRTDWSDRTLGNDSTQAVPPFQDWSSPVDGERYLKTVPLPDNWSDAEEDDPPDTVALPEDWGDRTVSDD